MRNGKALLTQTLKAAACTFCLFAWCTGAAIAAELEETDSGAPSALVMFPVTGDGTAVKGSMKPAVFNHLVHEKAVEDCTTCHHTGDPQSCSDCHTLTGSPKGKGITLERAMHATNIAPRANGKTPVSCVSCHEQYYKSKNECAGCHSIVTPKKDDKWCAVCHYAEVTPEQLAKGTSGAMSEEENLEIATKVVTDKKANEKVGYFAPTKVTIDALADEYKPHLFAHRRHVASLVEGIKDDKLADAFHYQPEVICATCHHYSPLSMQPPKCGSCHSKTIDPANPDRPTLKAAYHLNCIGCHNGMNVARPVATDCVACHKAVPAE